MFGFPPSLVEHEEVGRCDSERAMLPREPSQDCEGTGPSNGSLGHLEGKDGPSCCEQLRGEREHHKYQDKNTLTGVFLSTYKDTAYVVEMFRGTYALHHLTASSALSHHALSVVGQEPRFLLLES